MKDKVTVKVYESDANYQLKNEKLVTIINRVVYHRGWVGNFVPHFCRYKNQEYQVFGGIDYGYMHEHDNSNNYIILRGR